MATTKAQAVIRAIAQFGASQDDPATPQPATPERCDWCGVKTAHLSDKPTYDGSRGAGRGYHVLCRRCVARYNQEAREWRAKHAK